MRNTVSPDCTAHDGICLVRTPDSGGTSHSHFEASPRSRSNAAGFPFHPFSPSARVFWSGGCRPRWISAAANLKFLSVILFDRPRQIRQLSNFALLRTSFLYLRRLVRQFTEAFLTISAQFFFCSLPLPELTGTYRWSCSLPGRCHRMCC